MFMCRVFSCVVERGCLLRPVRSLGGTLLASALLHFVLQGQICLLLQVFLNFLLLHSNTLWWKGLFFFLFVLIVEGLVGHHRTVQLQLIQHQWLGHSLGLLWLLKKHIVTVDYRSLIRVFSWNLLIKYRKKWLGCAAVRMEVYWEIFQSMSLFRMRSCTIRVFKQPK